MAKISLALVGVVGLFAVAAISAYVFFIRVPDRPSAVVETKREYPERRVIGKSVEGRDIEAYTYTATSGANTTKIFFVGGMHGGYEWNSILLAYEAMDYLKNNPGALPKNISVTIVPDANPDGTYTVIGKEGRFSENDVPKNADQSVGRFNAHGVDLNRNFGCKWKPKSTWRNREVSAGTEPFSEPESRAIRDLVLHDRPSAVIYWHSQANAVYASECENGILPQTLQIMQAYADAAGYPAVKSFDAYPVTGDTEGWLASIGIPAITVEMSSHESIEWEKNLAGIRAILLHFQKP